MSAKLRTLLLPGMATFATMMGLAGFFYLAGAYDKLLWKEPSFSPAVYGVFWCGLVPIGALSAWVSRQAGGNTTDRILAALFPVVLKVVGYFLLLPFTLLISGPSSLHFVFGGVGFVPENYILAPGAALLMGALLFLGPKTAGHSNSIVLPP